MGIGPVFAVQAFESTGLVMFSGFTQTFADAALQNGVGAPVPNLSDNGHDYSTGFGVAAGLWTGNDTFGFGLSYQSKMSMGEFDKYSDLFAQDGGFDIPSTLTINDTWLPKPHFVPSSHHVAHSGGKGVVELKAVKAVAVEVTVEVVAAGVLEVVTTGVVEVEVVVT